jgi:hypothetical protein
VLSISVASDQRRTTPDREQFAEIYAVFPAFLQEKTPARAIAGDFGDCRRCQRGIGTAAGL